MSNRGLRYSRVEDMPAGMQQLLQKARAVESKPAPALRSEEVVAAPKRSKYGNVVTMVDGIRFDSKREARYFEQLKLRQQAGEVHYWLRQVPMHLPGGTKYVLDFLVFLRDGSVDFVDVKGRETKEFRIKKREVEHHYPIKVLLA
ncbi:hypothetical protein CEK00_04785 [Stenotrophomonas maltophilia]|uniref:DUF1064 domain-containing protein n=2 Tax=Stenotrophomonas maltophilia TaxID=40324 RepID=A0A270NLZ2_STEMA|nr:hypothetical protein CEK00_04785 [Stenotrophomonas maltophilia]